MVTPGGPQLDTMWCSLRAAHMAMQFAGEGLKIESALGDLHLKNANVTDDAEAKPIAAQA